MHGGPCSPPEPGRWPPPAAHRIQIGTDLDPIWFRFGTGGRADYNLPRKGAPVAISAARSYDRFTVDLGLAAAAWLLAWLVYGLIGDAGIHDLIIRTCIFGIFALSLNLLVGYLGVVSFGHAAFFAAGAYVFGLLMQTGSWSIPAAMLVAILGTALLAAVIGAICLRAHEIYFSFLTLAFQMVLYSLIISFVSLTGGDQGLMGGYDKPVFLGIDLADPAHFYLFCVAWLVIVAVLLHQIVQSPFGYALRLIRDNAERADFLGLRVKLYRWLAFVMAGTFAAVAGVLQSLLDVGAFPEWAYWAKSAEPLFMILLGGMQTFLGPLVGAAIFELLNNLVTAYTHYYGLVLGLVVLAFVLGLRRGLLDFVWDAVARWRASAARRS